MPQAEFGQQQSFRKRLKIEGQGMKWTFLKVAASLPLLSGCGSMMYEIAPINATVVDSKTGAPLEGVHVLADWMLVRGGLDGTRTTGHLAVKETVTDRNGQFHFDGFVTSGSFAGELRNADPRLFFFKSGYEVNRFYNWYPVGGTATPGAERRSQLDGRSLKLRPVADEEVGPQFYLAFDAEIEAITEADCNWKKFPQLLLSMVAERKRMEAEYPGRSISLPSMRSIELYGGASCGSPSEYFESLNR